jgi:hypothetical protein
MCGLISSWADSTEDRLRGRECAIGFEDIVTDDEKMVASPKTVIYGWTFLDHVSNYEIS